MLPKLSDFKLSLLGKELVPVQVAKDLGVTLDPHLTFNDHIIDTPACLTLDKLIKLNMHLTEELLSQLLMPWFLVNCFIAQMCGQTLPTVILTNYNLHRTSRVEL